MVTVTRRVFRRGIELVRNRAGWKLSSDEVVADVASLVPSCGETEILIEQDYGHGNRPRTSLLLPSREYFGLETTYLRQRFGQPGAVALFQEWNEVVYLLQAVGYHCSNLAEGYARIRKDYARIPRSPNDDHALFSGASDDVWYELDALLSAARRTLDISRFAIWLAYGNKGTCPRNFATTLGVAASIPQTLRCTLDRTWTNFGAKLSDYRDCIQHNTSLTMGFGDVHMDKRAHGVWLVSAYLPDNPETKSQSKFTYASKLDVLDYAYTITVEWLSTMKAVARSIAPHPDFDRA